MEAIKCERWNLECLRVDVKVRNIQVKFYLTPCKQEYVQLTLLSFDNTCIIFLSLFFFQPLNSPTTKKLYFVAPWLSRRPDFENEGERAE